MSNLSRNDQESTIDLTTTSDDVFYSPSSVLEPVQLNYQPRTFRGRDGITYWHVDQDKTCVDTCRNQLQVDYYETYLILDPRI